MNTYKRDPETQMILNTDSSAYETYLRVKQNALNSVRLEQEVETMRQEMTDIKDLLAKLIDKL